MKPLLLPSLSSTEVKFSTLVAALSREIDLSIAGEHWRFRIENACSSIKGYVVAALSIGDFSASLLIEKTCFARFCQEYQGIDKLPTDLQIACLTSALQSLFTKIEESTHMPVAINALSAHRAKIDTPYQIDMRCIKSGSRCRLVADEALAMWCVENLKHYPLKKNSSIDHLSFSGRYILGETRLRHRDLQSLATGDVVLLDKNYGIQDKQLLLHISPKRQYGITYDHNRARVTDIREKSMSTSTQTVDGFESVDEPQQKENQILEDANLRIVQQQAEREAKSPMEEIEVDLTFDVGSRTFTLQEINQFDVGYSFDLGLDLSDPVSLRANGKLIARCELVEINCRLGARIVSLLGKGVS